MYLALNELSFEKELSKIQCIEEAKTVFSNFVRFLRDLKAEELVMGLVATGDFINWPIYEKYTIREWLNDKQVDKVYRQFLRSYIGKSCSYVSHLDLEKEFLLHIDEKIFKSAACLFAAQNQYAITSIMTNEYWKSLYIVGDYIELDSEGQLVEHPEYPIENWTECLAVENLKKQKISRLMEGISSGQDLWEKRSILFPNLIFCEAVKAQLYMDPEKFHIMKIMERLKGLQSYFEHERDRYDPARLGMHARTESDTVKQDGELKKYRKFKLPDGEERYFYDHIGFTGKFSGGRIHFLPDTANGICYIGYIGRHLPTKKFS